MPRDSANSLTLLTPKTVSMKWKLYLPVTFLFLFSLSGINAQSTASEGLVEYEKGTKVAAVIEIPYAPATAEQAIKEYLASKGVKGKKSKGFNICRSVAMKEGNVEMNDLHFKVERKSKKEKNASRVYLLAGRPGENMGLRTAGDRHKVEEAKEFLNQLLPSIVSYNLNQEIEKQREMVTKAEKRLNALQEDQKGLEEKLNAIRNDKQKQLDEIAKQKAILEAIEVKRKAS
jgi:hypothetical protein